jgi:hypothetical protein
MRTRRGSGTGKRRIGRKRRDYAAEYARRIARALARGLSRSQARGHPKAGELAASAKRPIRPIPDALLQRALRTLRQHGKLKDAAKAARVSPERLRRFAKSQGAITKKGRRWIVNPKLPRRMLIYSRRRAVPVILGDQASATIAGRYMSAVGEFLSYQDISLLQPFAGQSVTDVRRKKHPFETDPNWLYRLASSGESFEAVYRIIV